MPVWLRRANEENIQTHRHKSMANNKLHVVAAAAAVVVVAAAALVVVAAAAL